MSGVEFPSGISPELPPESPSEFQLEFPSTVLSNDYRSERWTNLTFAPKVTAYAGEEFQPVTAQLIVSGTIGGPERVFIRLYSDTDDPFRVYCATWINGVDSNGKEQPEWVTEAISQIRADVTPEWADSP